jgi:hypothetical protein
MVQPWLTGEDPPGAGLKNRTLNGNGPHYPSRPLSDHRCALLPEGGRAVLGSSEGRHAKDRRLREIASPRLQNPDGRRLLLVPVLYAIFVMDLKILKWEEKGKQLHLETNEVAAD